MELNKKLLSDYLQTSKGKVEIIECWQEEYLIYVNYIGKGGINVKDYTISLLDLISFVYSRIIV